MTSETATRTELFTQEDAERLAIVVADLCPMFSAVAQPTVLPQFESGWLIRVRLSGGQNNWTRHLKSEIEMVNLIEAMSPYGD